MADGGDNRLPSGVVTFLTAGFARPTERQADEQRPGADAADELRRLVSGFASAHRGVVVDDDSGAVTAVFGRASDALRAATAVLTSSPDKPRSVVDSFRPSVAVHTAEAYVEDGRYRGPELDRVARLCAAAVPGEILVSGATNAVVRSSLPEGMGLRELGSMRGRGLTEVDVCRLVSPELADPAESAGDILDQAGVTPRERDVFHAVADRLTNAEIADLFVVSERTVESHVSSLLRKLGAANRLELADIAQSQRSTTTDDALPPVVALAISRSRCVGRDEERQRLFEAWEEVEGGQSALLLLTGEAGIGKSRLAADLAERAHQRGARILFGGATDGAGVPLEPLAEALGDVVAKTPEHVLRDDLGSGVTEVARVVPEVCARLGITAADFRADDLSASKVAIATYLRRVAEREPVLLVLEDLHWATPQTREVVLEIARRAAPVPLLVVATSRDVPPDRDEQLTEWLAAAERLPSTTRETLRGLDREATAALLQELESDSDPEHARDRTRGNPLFLRELATTGTTGETMQEFVSSRFALLDTNDRMAVEVAAVLGESFSSTHVAAASERSVLDVLDSLDAAGRAGLVQQYGSGSLRFSFSHALVRDAVYAMVRTGRRLRLHARVASVLDGTDVQAADLPELARHAAIAAPIGGAARAVELCRMAGERALNVGDLWSAMGHFDRAVDIADLADLDSAAQLELTIRLGESLVFHDRPRSMELLRDVALRARDLGLYEAMAEAVCAMTSWGGSVTPGELEPTFVRLADEALELLGENGGVWAVRLQALLGAHLALATEPERGRSLCDAAVAGARRLGDAETLVRSILSKRYSIGEAGRGEIVDQIGEAERLAESAGLVSLQEIAASAAAHHALGRGDIDLARQWFEKSWSLTEAHTANTYVLRTILAVLAGDLDEATRRNTETYRALAPELAFLYPGVTGLVISLLRGELRLPPMAAQAELDTFVGSGTRGLLGLQAVVDNDAERAGELLDAERRRGLADMTRYPFHNSALSAWSEVAAFVDDGTAALELHEFLAPQAGGLAGIGFSPWCPVDYFAGLLLSTAHRDAAAIATLERAVGASRSRHTPIMLGRELVALARARIRAGEPRAAVEELLVEARAIEASTGAGIISNDIARHVGSDS